MKAKVTVDTRDTLEGRGSAFPAFLRSAVHQSLDFDDVPRAGRAHAAYFDVTRAIGDQVETAWPLWTVPYMDTPLIAVKEA